MTHRTTKRKPGQPNSRRLHKTRKHGKKSRTPKMPRQMLWGGMLMKEYFEYEKKHNNPEYTKYTNYEAYQAAMQKIELYAVPTRNRNQTHATAASMLKNVGPSSTSNTIGNESPYALVGPANTPSNFKRQQSVRKGNRLQQHTMCVSGDSTISLENNNPVLCKQEIKIHTTPSKKITKNVYNDVLKKLKPGEITTYVHEDNKYYFLYKTTLDSNDISDVETGVITPSKKNIPQYLTYVDLQTVLGR